MLIFVGHLDFLQLGAGTILIVCKHFAHHVLIDSVSRLAWVASKYVLILFCQSSEQFLFVPCKFVHFKIIIIFTFLDTHIVQQIAVASAPLLLHEVELGVRALVLGGEFNNGILLVGHLARLATSSVEVYYLIYFAELNGVLSAAVLFARRGIRLDGGGSHSPCVFPLFARQL